VDRLKKIANINTGLFKRILYRSNYHKHFTRFKFTKISYPEFIYISPTNYKKDGGCSQLLRQLSIITFTRAHNFSYLHIPISEVSHNVNNDSDWDEKWEQFLNLSNFSVPMDHHRENGKKFKNFNKLTSEIVLNSKSDNNRYYKIDDCFPFIYHQPESLKLIQNDLRDSYKSNKFSKNIIFEPDLLNISIHIRRGDVTANRNNKRFTTTDKLVQIIRRIKSQLGDRNYCIYGFCVDYYDDFLKLESEGVKIIHDFDIFQVMNHLISSDLLVMSKSTISYISALLNEGIIIHEPFLYPPLDEWLNIENFESDLINKLS
jgi:hypothetical protein